MKLIIDIPEEEYRNIWLMSKDGIGMALYDWVANGTPLSEELEKIKAEIEDIRSQEENIDSSWCAGLKYVNNKIIDKHIAELKGE